ncbi:oligosaccharide flippase family protein [Mycobacterium yunnanensis]|uniref:Oligosaccharide flippase family protein n=1 Tax=Mycobacterium yunnanensis TaxID=368477 RepID=A0A9X2Z2G8_9MYCO|nr:hypothetical protein [Mycobacterium yunnanensis]MCV7421496.1 oligosaccharide flippase family protein [Mycobacterium yunnanensis]
MSNARKNALSYYLNTAVTAIVGLVINPLLLNALGNTNFGAWKTIQRLLDVGSSANGGAMQSLKWVIAHRSKSATDEEKRRDVGAALVVLLYWSPILLAVSAVIVVLLPTLMHGVPDEDIKMVYVTGSILGINVVLLSLAAVPDAVLIGTNQGYRSVNVTTVVSIITNAAMLVAANLGWGPEGVAATIAVGTGVNGVLTFHVLRRRVSWWGYGKPSKDDIRRVSKFSGWVLGWTFVNRLSLATEVIVLSALAGVAFVSSYTFTSYVAAFALSICQLTTSSLMPKLGSLVGVGEWEQAQTVAREARELTIALSAGIGCLVILLNGTFVALWAGHDQFMGQGVNVIMAITFVQFAIMRTDTQIQDTGLDIGLKVIFGAVMTVSALAAAGTAYALSNSIELMFISICAIRSVGSIAFPLLANRAIHSSTWPIGRAAVAALVLSMSIVGATFIHPTGLAEFIGAGLLSTGVLAPLLFFTTLSSSTRRKIVNR